jgi:hypothetical protein
MTSSRLVVASIIALAASGCGSVVAPEDALSGARKTWAQRGITSYSFTVARSCECLPEMAGPVVVTVRNGVVESRTYAAGAQAGMPVTTYAHLFPAIAGLFDFIDDAIRSPTDGLVADYDLTWGYPVHIHLPGVESLTIRVTDFVRR